jgi:hypothetical protein
VILGCFCFIGSAQEEALTRVLKTSSIHLCEASKSTKSLLEIYSLETTERSKMYLEEEVLT